MTSKNHLCNGKLHGKKERSYNRNYLRGMQVTGIHCAIPILKAQPVGFKSKLEVRCQIKSWWWMNAEMFNIERQSEKKHKNNN